MAVLSMCMMAALTAVLAVHLVRIRARVRHLERESADLSRSLAAVQEWAAKELTFVRGELTVTRLNESAAQIKAHRAEKRATSAVSPPEADDAEGQRETLAMPALATPAAGDDEATRAVYPRPPTYARRALASPPAPLAHPDLIGSEDIADEVSPTRLGPEDITPSRHGRGTMLVPVFRGPEEGSAA